MINFLKYNSSGNDFIIIDNREKMFISEVEHIRKVCDRNFGIGADGLILLELSSQTDYFMNYFNSDGRPSSFCGNGSMCCGHFAETIGILKKKNNQSKGVFSTREGNFSVHVHDKKVSISMPDVLKNDNIKLINMNNEVSMIINTGSPHALVFKSNLDNIDVNKEGAKIRYSDTFKQDGINVTFLEDSEDIICIRTYERGVERETLSCGTAVVAAALSQFNLSTNSSISIKIKTRGGIFTVQFKFEQENQIFSNIILSNEVDMVFEGNYPNSQLDT